MILAFMLAASEPAQTTPAAPDCSYDTEAMLALDRDAFDQDMDGGWRTLAKREGCELAAAELIREWRHAKRDHASILYWHEGQMRATAGQADAAIALFELTYGAPELDQDFGWNHYVSGTIAFLRGNRDRLRQSIEQLKAIPKPANNSFTRPDGTVVEMPWPPNLNVLQGFERCWGQSYKAAYSRECTQALAL